MRIILIMLLCCFLFSCSGNKKELYQHTDKFVELLETTYKSYGMQGFDDAKTTSDGLYKITPIGRLINVKIEKVVPDEDYEKLRSALERRYKKDKRVNQVYINQGGTIMIDCRN